MLSIESIHPIAVHFPIVFGLTLAAFDVVMLIMRRPIGGRGTFATISAGIAVLAGVFALIASTFGDMALEAVSHVGVPAAAFDTHEMLGSSTATGLAIWAAVRALGWWRQIDLSGWRVVAVVLVELLFCAAIITTAYYGGELVFAHGVAVAK